MADATSKRARGTSEVSSKPPADAKRVCTSQEQAESKSSTGDDSTFERIKDVSFPGKIVALPHVMNLIATLAMTPEEALKEAMTTHQLDWMKQIIARFDCDLTEIMVQAAATDQHDVVELVLTDGFDFDEDTDLFAIEATDDTKNVLKKGILAAAQNGHLDIVKLLLQIVLGLWSRWFSVVRDVIDEAAANGQVNVVKVMVPHAFILGYATQYSRWPPVDTLSKVILGGHTDVAEFLINQSRILWDLKGAYVAAVDQGQTALAGRIYEVYPQQMGGRKLFLDLASLGHLDAVKYLYNNGCNDSGLFLVDTGRVNSEVFDKAFKIACPGYNAIHTVTFLYNLKRVSPQGINHGFECSNDVAVMKLLYDKEKISEKAITTAFTKSLPLHRSRDSEIILFLYRKPCISSELIDTAFVNAVLSMIAKRYVNTLRAEVVTCLRDDDRLSSKVMGEAFVEVVKNREVDMMKMLYEERRTPGEALVRAFLEAAHRKRIDLVKDILMLLSAKEKAPQKFMHEAFIAAARHGQMAILEIVHQSQPADLFLMVLKNALDVAGGNGKIDNFIRKLMCDQVFKRLQAAETS
ncbi:hypothetical protein V7S43_007278 [Phytophthora oleae]|uniref:Uncharacterized protein n=1 Tax=Phytophthora oleae TaxID=2107226 RepID=A0ABD3FLD8_9STRA